MAARGFYHFCLEHITYRVNSDGNPLDFHCDLCEMDFTYSDLSRIWEKSLIDVEYHYKNYHLNQVRQKAEDDDFGTSTDRVTLTVFSTVGMEGGFE